MLNVYNNNPFPICSHDIEIPVIISVLFTFEKITPLMSRCWVAMNPKTYNIKKERLFLGCVFASCVHLLLQWFHTCPPDPLASFLHHLTRDTREEPVLEYVARQPTETKECTIYLKKTSFSYFRFEINKRDITCSPVGLEVDFRLAVPRQCVC